MSKKTLKGTSSLLCLILVTTTLFLTAGCWSRRELEDLAFVMVLGIEKGEEGDFRILAQIGEAMQAGGGEGEEGSEIIVLEATGKTISAAYDRLFEPASKRPFLSHTRVVIISEELAEEGINRLLDFLQRDIRIRSNTVILIGQGDVKEILETDPVLGGIPGLAIDEGIRFNWERSKIFRKELFEMIRDIKEEDIELVLPMISLVDEVKTIRNAAFFENTTMKGTLDNKQVLGLMWLMADVRHGVITINPRSEEARYATFEMQDTNVSVNPVEQDNGLVFIINIDQRLRVTDDQTNLSVSEMEAEVNEYIKNTILETVNLAKEEGIDFIGFGKRYRRKYPNRWNENEWTNKFQESEVIIRVSSKINSEDR